MSAVAFLLVVTSAFMHATWNFQLKRSEDKGAFLACLGTFAFVILLAPAVGFALFEGMGAEGLALGAVTTGLHGTYGILLSRSYHLGDLSTAYPVSRGMGLALIPVFAVLLLGEHVSLMAAGGIVLIAIGIYAVHIDTRLWRDLTHPARALAAPATQMAFLTGIVVACYSRNLFVLTPFVLLSGDASVLRTWDRHRGELAIAGILTAAAYTLVLAALTTSRVSYIAPTREVGIVIGTALGVVLLGEGYGITRVWGSGLIVAGVLTVALAP
ncbi:MAG: hypothetical protein E6J42_09160 [Chloroflexi bacterium]|nr:MAG: hypothetical protein E6J42_09160 [Chloroflexota bacterium]